MSNEQKESVKKDMRPRIAFNEHSLSLLGNVCSYNSLSVKANSMISLADQLARDALVGTELTINDFYLLADCFNGSLVDYQHMANDLSSHFTHGLFDYLIGNYADAYGIESMEDFIASDFNRTNQFTDNAYESYLKFKGFSKAAKSALVYCVEAFWSNDAEYHKDFMFYLAQNSSENPLNIARNVADFYVRFNPNMQLSFSDGHVNLEPATDEQIPPLVQERKEAGKINLSDAFLGYLFHSESQNQFYLPCVKLSDRLDKSITQPEQYTVYFVPLNEIDATINREKLTTCAVSSESSNLVVINDEFINEFALKD